MNETGRKGKLLEKCSSILQGATKSPCHAGQSSLSSKAQSPYFPFPGPYLRQLKQRLFIVSFLTLAILSDEKCSASVLQPAIKILKLEGLMALASTLSAAYDTSSVQNYAYNSYDEYSEDSLLNVLVSVAHNQQGAIQFVFTF